LVGVNAQVQAIKNLSAAPDVTPAEADEFGDLKQAIRDFKPKIDRCEQLRLKFIAMGKSRPAAKGFVVEGERYSVPVSECESKRTMSAKAKALLLKFWGMKKFLARCKVNLEEFDRYVTKDKRGMFVREEKHGGGRTVTAIAKAAA
jgi:hypothetical protein